MPLGAEVVIGIAFGPSRKTQFSLFLKRQTLATQLGKFDPCLEIDAAVWLEAANGLVAPASRLSAGASTLSLLGRGLTTTQLSEAAPEDWLDAAD